MHLRPRRAWLVSSALVLASLLAIVPSGYAQGTAAQAAPMNVRTVLEQGQQLENQRRWGEALSLYEESLRELPGEHGPGIPLPHAPSCTTIWAAATTTRAFAAR